MWKSEKLEVLAGQCQLTLTFTAVDVCVCGGSGPGAEHYRRLKSQQCCTVQG